MLRKKPTGGLSKKKPTGKRKPTKSPVKKGKGYKPFGRKY